MTPEKKREISRLLTSLESDRVERKPSLADREDIRRAICAFANDLPHHGQPGCVFLGASDTGEPLGSDVTDRVLQTLSDMRTQGNILPPPVMSVRRIERFREPRLLWWR